LYTFIQGRKSKEKSGKKEQVLRRERQDRSEADWFAERKSTENTRAHVRRTCIQPGRMDFTSVGAL
jgi:hypothetical protein